MYGHSAVYHRPSNAIYVFGGYEYQTDKNVPSSNLYTIDVGRGQWNVLPPDLDNRVGDTISRVVDWVYGYC